MHTFTAAVSKGRCSWRQFHLKHLTAVRIFRSPKTEVQSYTSWCTLFRTATPCYSGALSLTERSKSPFSALSVPLGLRSVASTEWPLPHWETLRHLRHPQGTGKYHRETSSRMLGAIPSCSSDDARHTWLDNCTEAVLFKTSPVAVLKTCYTSWLQFNALMKYHLEHYNSFDYNNS